MNYSLSVNVLRIFDLFYNLHNSAFGADVFYAPATKWGGAYRFTLVRTYVRLSHLLYTGIYAEGYIVFTFPFVCSYVRLFVLSLLSGTFVEFTSKFLVKISLSEYISLTTHQKAFIFEPWVPERVIFNVTGFGHRVHAPG